MFADNEKAIFGAGSDLQIYHDGTHSRITDSGTGNLRVRATDFRLEGNTGSDLLSTVDGAGVTLYYANAAKLATTSTGVDITGVLSSDALNVSAASPNIDVTDTGTSHASQDFLTNSNAVRATIGVERSSGGGLFVGSSPYAAVFGTASAGNTEFATNNNVRMTISSSGNVGIGTSSPSSPLQIQSSNNQIRLVDSQNTSMYCVIETISDAGLSFNDVAGAAASSRIQFNVDNSEKMRIDNDGNVGIGTNSPQSLLSVKVSTSRQLDVVKDSGDDHLVLKSTAPDASYYLRSIELAGNDVSFSTGSHTGTSYTERLRIDSSGRVGIGTSSPATGGIHIAGDYASNKSDITLQNTNGGRTYRIGDGVGGHVGKLTFFDGTASAARMVIDSSGNVGIGTTSPAGKLAIASTGNTGSSLEAYSATDSIIPDFQLLKSGSGTVGTLSTTASGEALGQIRFTGIDTANNKRDGAKISVYQDSAATSGTVPAGIRFDTTGSERMRIDASGRVAIGDVPKASFTGHSILQVGGQAILGANDALSSTGQTYLTHNIYYDTSGTPQVFNTSTANEGTVYTQVDGVHKWSNSAQTTGTPSVQERMRLTSAGDLLVGKTSTSLAVAGARILPTGQVYSTASGVAPFAANRLSSDGTIMEFYKDTGLVGTIAVLSGDNLCFNGQTGDTGGFIANNTAVAPAYQNTNRDNYYDLGTSSARWDDVYATNGTIQTSDRNEKQDIAELSDAEQRVAVAAKGLLRKFRWRDSVEAKGDEARTHFGIIAQDLQAAFAAEGLDAGDYAMFISSTWTDEETGEERTRMGVRYSELLAFIIAAI